MGIFYFYCYAWFELEMLIIGLNIHELLLCIDFYELLYDL